MKTLIRSMTLSIVFALLCGIFLQMMSDNVRYDELNSCITTAVSTTQIVMKENIEDRLNGTHAARKQITSNEEYLRDFKNNLMKLKTTDTEYTILVYGIDYEKGLIDVGVEGTYRSFTGDEKKIFARKINMIDVVR